MEKKTYGIRNYGTVGFSFGERECERYEVRECGDVLTCKLDLFDLAVMCCVIQHMNTIPGVRLSIFNISDE